MLGLALPLSLSLPVVDGKSSLGRDRNERLRGGMVALFARGKGIKYVPPRWLLIYYVIDLHVTFGILLSQPQGEIASSFVVFIGFINLKTGVNSRRREKRRLSCGCSVCAF